MSEGLPDDTLFPPSVGERLKKLRESAKLDLNDIATRTRIPLRHLEAIERSDYSALPSPTYSIGFVRSFARAIGADDAGLAKDLRVEMGREQPGAREAATYDLADPARVPPRLLAWTAALLALLIAGGYWLWRNDMFGSGAAPATVSVPPPTPTSAPNAAPSTPAPPLASVPAPNDGQVVLTATSPVWVRIRDADGKRLLEKEMTASETFAVPRDAKVPVIQTGKPEAIAVTIDGKAVPPIGAPATLVKDVPISAAALAARQAPGAAGTATAPRE